MSLNKSVAGLFIYDLVKEVREREQIILQQFTRDYHAGDLNKDDLFNKMVGIFELRSFTSKVESDLDREEISDGK